MCTGYRNLRTLIAILFAGSTLSLLVFHANRVLAATPTACVPFVIYHGGIVTCYSSNQVSETERRLSVAPMNPATLIKHLLHLSLGQVLALQAQSRGRIGPVIALVYVFGVPEPACRRLKGCRPGAPYVIVQETLGHRGIDRIELAEDPATVPGPWHLNADMPDRDLTLNMIANIGRKRIIELGRGLLTLSLTAPNHT